MTTMEMEMLLATLHGVTESHRIALKGRVKHFQRNGWPTGINTGKGKPATFNFERVAALCLAFEIAQLGVTPDRTVEVLANAWPSVRESLLVVLTRPNSINEPLNYVFLYCDPMALSDLTNSLPATSQQGLHWISGANLVESLSGRASIPRRLALVNLTQLIYDVWRCLAKIGLVAGSQHQTYTFWERSL